MANNIGIHPIPKGWRSRDDYTYDPDFKYQSMIVEQNANKKGFQRRKILKL